MNVIPQNCRKSDKWNDNIFFLLTSLRPNSVTVILFPKTILPLNYPITIGISFA